MNADGDVDCVKKVIKDNKFSAFNQQNEIYRFSLTCFIYLHLENIYFFFSNTKCCKQKQSNNLQSDFGQRFGRWRSYFHTKYAIRRSQNLIVRVQSAQWLISISR